MVLNLTSDLEWRRKSPQAAVQTGTESAQDWERALHSRAELENCDSRLLMYDMMPNACLSFFMHLYNYYRDESLNFLTMKLWVFHSCEKFNGENDPPKTNWEIYLCEEIIVLSPSLVLRCPCDMDYPSLTRSFSLRSSFPLIICSFSSFHRICDEFNKKVLTFAFVCHFVLATQQTVEFSRTYGKHHQFSWNQSRRWQRLRMKHLLVSCAAEVSPGMWFGVSRKEKNRWCMTDWWTNRIMEGL